MRLCDCSSNLLMSSKCDSGVGRNRKKKKESSSAVLRLNETALPENLQGNRKNRSMNQNNY